MIQKIKTDKYLIEVDDTTSPLNTLRVINLTDFTSYVGAYTSSDFIFEYEALKLPAKVAERDAALAAQKAVELSVLTDDIKRELSKVEVPDGQAV